MKGKSLLDPTFRYTPSTSTDIRKTFARIRREQKQQQADAVEAAAKVKPLRKPAP